MMLALGGLFGCFSICWIAIAFLLGIAGYVIFVDAHGPEDKVSGKIIGGIGAAMFLAYIVVRLL